MLFFMLMNVKMPIIVGILTFMSRKIPCSVELSMKKSFIKFYVFIDSGHVEQLSMLLRWILVISQTDLSKYPLISKIKFGHVPIFLYISAPVSSNYSYLKVTV